MATARYSGTRTYVWQPADFDWLVLARNLAVCGYPDVGTFYDDMVALNPQIMRWDLLAPGSIVLLPVIPGSGSR